MVYDDAAKQTSQVQHEPPLRTARARYAQHHAAGTLPLTCSWLVLHVLRRMNRVPERSLAVELIRQRFHELPCTRQRLRELLVACLLQYRRSLFVDPRGRCK
jgi:hypothetical protein